MTLEVNPNYPSDLDSTAPAAGDLKAEGDDHLRNIKRVLKTTLPNVSGAITPTHTELNYVDGVTSAIQTQMDAKAPLASPSLTGTPTAPTATVGTGTTQIATTAFVAATALVSALPGQVGSADKHITTDGANASWTALLKSATMRWADSTDITKLVAYDLSGLTTGTTRTVAVPNKNGTMAMTSDLVISTVFTSAEQTITSAGALTLAHSLGARPTVVLGYLKCVTAESGYSIGDVVCVPVGPAYTGAGTGNTGVSVVPDATNLNVRYGSAANVFPILNKTTGAGAVATNANWTLSFRAFV